jgi:protein O-mannosyl-transferase
MGYTRKGSMVKDHNHTLFNLLLVILCLIIGIVVVYIKVQNFDFVGYDDELYVTKNLHVQNGVTFEGIKWAFTTFHSANWHPLTWLSHMLDYELYGLDPSGHHWTNVEFHIANTLLLFIILFRMTGAIWRSAFVAALFALHPLHVESVAWISERKDVLSTFFGLLTVAAYCRYAKKSSTTNYLMIIICFSLGLMAKPMLVTLPFVLLLLDYWPLKRFQYQRDFYLESEKVDNDVIKKKQWIILEKIPLFLLVVISCIVTFFAQKSEGAVKTLETFSLKTRVANALVSYVSYVFKTIWPHKLAVIYPHPGNTLPLWQIIGAALLIVAACCGAIWAAKKYPYIPVGLFWYFGTLIPVIGLVQVGDQAMADRYTYIPLIGIFIVVAWGISDLFAKWRYQKLFLGVFVSIIIAALTSKTFLQLRCWENAVSLFEHAIKVTENNYHAYNNLGTALGTIDPDRAIAYYKEALKINPAYGFALYNLGTILIQKKDYHGAVLYLNKLLKLNPRHIDARNNLAKIFFLQSKPDEAISQYREILQIDSENADVNYNLAYVLSIQGKLDEAVLFYNETLRIDPEYSKAHYNLGNICLNQGKTTEAFMHYAEVVKIKPDDVQAYNKLGLILLQYGKFNKAKVFFSKAIQIDPNYPEARKNLDILNQTLPSSDRSYIPLPLNH